MKTGTAMPAWNPAETARKITVRHVVLLMSLIGLAGLWLRLRNLGALPLVGDEAIQALALRGLLEHGIPRLETGYVYTRALLFTYLQAVPFRLFGVPFDAYWLRLPGAILGALVIVPVYAMARQFGGQRMALFAALLVACSAWEIELSRYARFYTLFQLAFVSAVYCFYRGFLINQRAWRYAFLAAGLVCFFSHHLSLLLFTLFLIPLAGGAWQRLPALAAWGGALAVVWYGQRFIERWVAGLGQPFDPAPIIDAGAGATGGILSRLGIGLSNLTAPNWQSWLELHERLPLLTWGIVLLGAAAAGWIVVQGVRRGQRLRSLLSAAAVLCASAYQFGLAALLLLGQLVWTRDPWRGLRAERVLLAGLGICLLLLGFWVTVLATTPGDWKTVTLTLFGVPNVLQHFVYWYVLGMPVLSLVVVVTALLLLQRFLQDRADTSALFLPASVLVPAVAASFFQAYYESRYVFHIYPLMIVMYALAAVAAADYLAARASRLRGLFSAGVLALAQLVSHDANPLLSWRITARDFGTERNPLQSVISWPLYAGFHADRQTPAEQVRHLRRPGERVLALGPIFMLAQFHYYAQGLDAVLNPLKWPDAYGRWRDGRFINYMTGAEIVTGTEGIQAFLDVSPGAVWILGDSLLLHEDNGYYSPAVRSRLQELTAGPAILGRDGVSFLARVPPVDARQQTEDEP